MPDVLCVHESGPGYWQSENVSGCLRAEGENRPSRPSNVICCHGSQDPITKTEHANAVNRNNGLESCICYDARGNGDGQTVNTILGHLLVRRLTPVECERLMGFPDNHTRIAYNGKPEEECPDSPRYKACGNSMCVNCMEWIGRQIERVENKKQEENQDE